jgi:hypothetical protein
LPRETEADQAGPDDDYLVPKRVHPITPNLGDQGLRDLPDQIPLT